MQNDDSENRIVEPERTEEERHDINNTKNVRNAAEVAIASGNPYAMAAGAAIKGADKITDGKASEAIGKTVSAVSKNTIGGRRIQKNLDKLAESGASDTIGTAASIKNGSPAKRATAASTSKPMSTTTPGNLTESVNSVEKNSELDAQGYLTTDDKKKVKVFILLALIFGGIFSLIFIVSIITIITEGDYDGYGEREYYEKACKQVLLKYKDKKTKEMVELYLDIDDYISWLMTFDTPATYSDEVLKAVSISARTHIISKGNRHGSNYDTCYYDAEIANQEYDPELIPENISGAVNDTRGMIITVDEEPTNGYYEESCVYTASQARRVNPSRSFDDSNYYVKYGALELDGDFFQPIPVEYISKVNDTLTSHASQAKNGHACAGGNRGSGISKDGAEYFAKFMSMTWDDIIDYYYNEQSIIMTIYTGSDQEGEIYRQGDPTWGSIRLGNSGTNMASSGCAVTAIAIGITYSDTPITIDNFDAGVFVKELNKGNCFTETGGIIWGCSTISKIAPAVRYVNTVNLSGSTNNKINAIKAYSTDRYFILAHFTNSKYARGHYVNFQEFSGSNKYVARDPATGTLTTQDVSEIDHIIIYSY